jgi:transcriptional regulator GlxA family with amidase domain
MSNQLMDFADRTGQEMFRLLAQRALDELSEQSGLDRFTAILAAALIPVAEVLREPIEKAQSSEKMADQMIELSSRQLRGLLQSVTGKGKSGGAA